jgi:uncharacterized iron-regulated protein
MVKHFIVGIFIVIVAAIALANHHNYNQPVLDLDRGQKTDMSSLIPILKTKRIILVGEHHGDKRHHMAQLVVIQTLVQADANVAIGLEMFREDSQKALDEWIAGEMNPKKFEHIYYKNWNFPYSAYGRIFEFARENKIPMIGLNVSREITRQVSRGGFDSLSEEKKGKLAEVTCRVDEAYMNYIRKAYGAHAHGNLNFIYFCEAQLIWDNVMAINTLAYLKKNPDAVVVVLTGVGHAQKVAIPRQIETRSTLPYAVILPEVPGKIDAQTVSKKEADYIMLDL